MKPLLLLVVAAAVMALSTSCTSNYSGSYDASSSFPGSSSSFPHAPTGFPVGGT